MNILITGGAGYIGSMLTPALLADGHDVTVLDNFRYGQTPLLDCCWHPGLKIVAGDCRDHATVKPLVQKADIIIILAAIVGAQACDQEPFDAETTNFGGVDTILSYTCDSQWILYPCTNSGYGVGQKDIHCDENTSLNPISLYGRTKVQAEARVLMRNNSISFRLATVFGSSPCLRTELLVNNFVLRALRDKSIVLFEPHFKRNYIHVRDVVSAFQLGINKFEQMKGSAYNVGLSTANLSKMELCELIKQHVDFEIIVCNNRKDPDQRNYLVSNEKIESMGFSPKHSIEEGIQELLKTYEITYISYHKKSFGY